MYMYTVSSFVHRMPRLGDAAPLDGLASATPTSTARQIEITDIQERRREKWLCSLFAPYQLYVTGSWSLEPTAGGIQSHTREVQW